METERPFDARLQLLVDRTSSEKHWSTVSLIKALREYLQREPGSVFPPCDEHADLLTRCAEELTSRGVDAQALVRYGMCPEIFGGIIGPSLSQWLHPQPLVGAPIEKAQAWLNLLEPRLERAGLSRDEPALPEITFGSFVSIAVQDLVPWILWAPLDDLLSLEPPTEDELSSAPHPDQIDQELMDQYRWAVERFAVTALTEWTTSSLHLELRWMTQVIAPPVAAALMEEHSRDQQMLEAEIARRAVNPVKIEHAEHAQLRSSLAARMHRKAIDLLRDQKFSEAAVLFEFALIESPNDVQALNNLGFCLMPTDLRAARGHLQRSADLGYTPAAINLYNRVLCTYRLTGATAALSLAEAEWPTLQPTAAAFLWEFDGEHAILECVEDARRHLASFATRLALECSRDDLADTWTARCAA